MHNLNMFKCRLHCYMIQTLVYIHIKSQWILQHTKTMSSFAQWCCLWPQHVWFIRSFFLLLLLITAHAQIWVISYIYKYLKTDKKDYVINDYQRWFGTHHSTCTKMGYLIHFININKNWTQRLLDTWVSEVIWTQKDVTQINHIKVTWHNEKSNTQSYQR